MDWREDLLNFLTEQKYYRLNYLNNQLSELCKKWIELINEFRGLKAKIIDKSFTYKGIEIDCSYIEITDNMKGRLPYKAYLGYFSNESEELCLLTNTTTVQVINIDRIIKAKDRGADHDFSADELYNWDDIKEIQDIEISEPDFILELLNKRFKNYFNNKAKISIHE